MARPRKFDRRVALERAMKTFWGKGYAATSTEDLLETMGLGRQSLYNAFGDKRQLYLEALTTYQDQNTAGHLRRLSEPTSSLEGFRDVLYGLISDDDRTRAMGCMGVGSVGEFGISDPELVALRAQAGPILQARFVERLREGQANHEIDPAIDANEAAGFIQLMMAGIQLAARAGAGAEDLRTMARFTVDRLRAAVR
jgi:TetR/AcrR family transcriptional repressor of nem operon